MIFGCLEGHISRKKKIVPVEKIFLPPHSKVCATNKPNPEGFRAYIDDQYSSKYHTFSPRISGDIWEKTTKKQGKIRFFQEIKTDGGTSRPRF